MATAAEFFPGWLRTIFQSRVVDHVRRWNGAPGAQGGSEALGRLHNIAQPDDSETDPAVQSLFRRVLELIQSEFNGSAWQAFWLTTVENRSSREAAREVGMTPGAVRQARYRILRRVRQELGDVE